MIYRIAADFILIVHFLFILFVVFGGLLVFRNKYWAAAHIPAAIWGTLIELNNWICPLTPLENRFLQKAGAEIYQGNCIEHYLGKIIYPPLLTDSIQLFFAACVIVINITIYQRYWAKTIRR